MGVTDLGDADGMLFVFDAEGVHRFYMWQTPMPLDIAFFAADGTFVGSAEMEPCLEPTAAACERYAPTSRSCWPSRCRPVNSTTSASVPVPGSPAPDRTANDPGTEVPGVAQSRGLPPPLRPSDQPFAVERRVAEDRPAAGQQERLRRPSPAHRSKLPVWGSWPAGAARRAGSGPASPRVGARRRRRRVAHRCGCRRVHLDDHREAVTKPCVGRVDHPLSPSTNIQPGQSVGLPAPSTDAPG